MTKKFMLRKYQDKLEYSEIYLSNEDTKTFIEHLLNPPEPAQTLIDLCNNYKKQCKTVKNIRTKTRDILLDQELNNSKYKIDFTNLIYLASPYTHENVNVMKNRAVKISKLAAKYIKKGIDIYCPITSTWMISKHSDLSGLWEDWENVNLNCLQRCDELHIVMLDKEWQTSAGMLFELSFAREAGMKVVLVNKKGNALQDVTADDILEMFHNPEKVYYK